MSNLAQDGGPGPEKQKAPTGDQPGRASPMIAAKFRRVVPSRAFRNWLGISAPGRPEKRLTGHLWGPAPSLRGFLQTDQAFEGCEAGRKLRVLGLHTIDVLQRFDLAGRDVGAREIVEGGFERAHLLMQDGDRAADQRQPVKLRPHGRQLGAQDGPEFVLGHLPHISPESTAYNARALRPKRRRSRRPARLLPFAERRPRLGAKATT
jgi:hypothetical protein